MVDKIIFTVTPIFFQFLPAERPLLKRGCIRLLSVPISQIALFVSRIRDTQITPLLMIIVVFIGLDFSRIYKRLFQKWTRLDPLPYSQRILNIAHDFPITKESIIVVHNSMKLYTQIRKRAPQARVVIHMHNAFEPKLLEQNVKMIVPSLYLKKYYQSYLANADIEIVPNGIDLETYQSTFQPITRSELNISPEEKIIFYAGRIVPDKGILLLMQSFEKLAVAHKNLKLVVIGDYTEMSKSDKGAYQHNVREIAKRLKDRCIMLGSIPPEKMHCYYPLADLVVIPSQFGNHFAWWQLKLWGLVSLF